MKRLNILALNWQDLQNPMSGGAEVHLEEMLRRLADWGHKVTLVCSNFRGGAGEEIIEKVRIVRAGNRYNFNFVAPLIIRRLTKAESFDLFLEDINKIPFYSPLYQKLPTIVIIPHLFSTAVFQEINFILGSYIYLAEMFIRPIYGKRKFCVISESTAADMVARGIPENEVSIIHCGIDRSLYNNSAGMKKFDRPTILYLGRIKKYKSIHHLISAFDIVRQKLPDARLVIVGAGDYLESLKKRAAGLGLEAAVEFTGFVPGDKKVEYLCRSHVMVYPSLKEGWGLTNIEANSCGTTAIAADTPGLRDSVRHGISGLLYPYGRIDRLAESLLAILTDDQLRRRLEQGALEWAERFHWDRSARLFEELCLAVAEKK